MILSFVSNLDKFRNFRITQPANMPIPKVGERIKQNDIDYEIYSRTYQYDIANDSLEIIYIEVNIPKNYYMGVGGTLSEIGRKVYFGH